MPSTLVLLTHLSHAIYRRATEEVLGMSLKAYVALGNVREQGALTQQSLCESLHLDPNNCVLLLNALEASTLIERRRDPADRRRHIVVLTAHGREAVERADAVMADIEAVVLAGLTPAERATLHGFLARAVEAGIREMARPQLG